MGKGTWKKTQNMGNGEQTVEEEIALKVYMHCEACVSKVLNCLKGFEGIEEVNTDMNSDRVIVKGQKADPLKVLERMKKKYSRNVELISPIPKIIANDNKELPKKQENPNPIEVVSLKMYIHCEGCANDIKKSIEKVKGILNVEPDMKNSTVTIEGRFDQSNIADTISQRLRKYAETVKVESKDDKGNEKGNKKETVKVESNDDDKGNGKGNNKKGDEQVIILSYPPQYSAENICPNHIFSDENIFSCSIM